jgi:hypothetical protein
MHPYLPQVGLDKVPTVGMDVVPDIFRTAADHADLVVRNVGGVPDTKRLLHENDRHKCHQLHVAYLSQILVVPFCT